LEKQMKIRKTLIFTFIMAVFMLGLPLAGCEQKSEPAPPPTETPSAEAVEEAAEAVEEAAEAVEETAEEHPTGEHPTGEHPN
jgi:hypothetical protein